jgi:hypothetical protein
MIIAVVGSSQTVQLLQSSIGDGSNKSKEAALQGQIASKAVEVAKTTCKDTAAKLESEVAALKAQLTALQATDEKTGNVSNSTSNSAAARQAEFDGDESSNSGKTMWV